MVPAFAIVVQRPEQGPVDIGRVAGELKTSPQSRGGPRLDCRRGLRQRDQLVAPHEPSLAAMFRGSRSIVAILHNLDDDRAAILAGYL